jgi:hypothetical protein
MTAIDFIDDIEFKAFCEDWKVTGNCSVGFADWLGEKLGESYLQAAIAAYSTMADGGNKGRNYGGLRPVVENDKDDEDATVDEPETYWWQIFIGHREWRSELTPSIFIRLKEGMRSDTRVMYVNYAVAIADYLDAASQEFT